MPGCGLHALLGRPMCSATQRHGGGPGAEATLSAVGWARSGCNVPAIGLAAQASPPACPLFLSLLPRPYSGYTAVGILLCYYAAPLSTMAEVLRSRSSASLYAPTSAMNTLNGLLWVAYGTVRAG